MAPSQGNPGGARGVVRFVRFVRVKREPGFDALSLDGSEGYRVTSRLLADGTWIGKCQLDTQADARGDVEGKSWFTTKSLFIGEIQRDLISDGGWVAIVV